MVWAPTKPMRTPGSAAFSAAAVCASWATDGVEVWMTISSWPAARRMTSSSVSSSGGASISVLSGTSAAACASQVGYQNERTSRRAW